MLSGGRPAAGCLIAVLLVLAIPLVSEAQGKSGSDSATPANTWRSLEASPLDGR
jgi:hypothetical protein